MTTKKKRPLSITILGAGAIVWGVSQMIYLLYFPVHHYFVHMPVEILPDFAPPHYLVKYFIGDSLFSVLFIFAGIGTLQMKKWGWVLYIMVGELMLFGILAYFLIFGNLFLTQDANYLLLKYALLGCLIIWYFNRKEMKKVFSLTQKDIKKESYANIFFVICSLVLIFCHLFFQFKFIAPKDPYFFKPIPRVTLEVKEKRDLPGRYTKRELVDIEIIVPSSWKLKPHEKSTFSKFFLTDEEDDVWFFSTYETLAEILTQSFDFIGIEDSYTFYNRLVSAQVGIVPLVIKTISSHTKVRERSTEAIFFAGWKGFLHKGHWVSGEGENTTLYDWHLWHEKSNSPMELNFVIKNDAVSESEIKDIISTLKFVDPNSK